MRLEREAELCLERPGECGAEDFLERPGEEGAEDLGGGVTEDRDMVGVRDRFILEGSEQKDGNYW